MNFIRQKKDVECFNQDIDRPTIDYYCECSLKDYECDIGYRMDDDTKKCFLNEEGIVGIKFQLIFKNFFKPKIIKLS